jgi:hypothetical protein
MDDDGRLGGSHRTDQGLAVEYVDHDRFDATRAEFLCPAR